MYPNTYALDAHEFEVSLGYRANLVSESRDTQSPFPHKEESLQAGYLKIYRYMGERKRNKENFKRNVSL